jgi:FkbH-like protein
MPISYPLDSPFLIKNKKKLKKQYLADGAKRTKKKIAFLCGSTANDIKDFCEIFLLDNFIEPSFYLSEYNQYWQDAMFGTPELDDFAPDLIYIHTTTRNIEQYFPNPADNREKCESLLEEVKEHYHAMWEKLEEKFHCPVIQNNFEYPRYRLLGNRDAFDFRGGVYFVNQMNEYISSYAAGKENFYINDASYISACYGLDRWSDQSAWYMYKYAMAIDAIPEFSFNLAGIIKSVFGKNKKALALDLDNTLWGGVVGDDGVENLKLGEETAEAQAYHDFQKYLKKVKDTGIMLTVDSKNDYENAVAGLNHKDGVLKPDDFIVIKANREPKNLNLTNIAGELNIGVDSIVFVDDNPAERHIITSTMPVSAPEMEGAENYIRILDRNGYFETTAFSDEDLKRNDMYKANMQREKELQSFGNYEDYLYSLDMKAEIRGFIPVYIQRIAQLTNKSNQFNVTTHRYTATEIEEMASDSNFITLYGKLEDRFGDNGVVSVVIGRKDGRILHVELWIMSCRVLKRDMEFAMLDGLVKRAKEQGIEEIRGYYYPTAKNGMVRELFGTFGFERFSLDEAGNSEWKLSTGGYTDKNRYIKVLDE